MQSPIGGIELTGTYCLVVSVGLSPPEGIKMLELMTALRRRVAGEDGQTMAEYAVVLAVIAIGIFVALGALSGAIGGALTTITGQI